MSDAVTAELAAEDALPRRLETEAGTLEISGLVSRSQTSVVCRAEAVEGGARVALKFHGDAAVAAHEAAILERLEGHPAPQLLGRHTVDGRNALLIAWTEGTSLADWAAEAPRDGEAVRRVLVALAEALRALHDRGVVHGDLKPGHVILRSDGTAGIIDFSAAAVRHEADPPGDEAAQSDGRPSADIRGFGEILHWLYTGRLPSDGATEAAAEDPPEAVEALVLARACLASDRDKRPADAAALLEALGGVTLPAIAPAEREAFPETERIRTRAPGVLPEPPAPPVVPKRRRGGAGRALAVGLALVLLGGAAFAGYHFGLPYYDRHYRLVWTVDTLGNGDARTIGEVLERGGQDLTILLPPGRYTIPPVVARRVALRPVEGAAEPPVIAGEGGSCLSLSVADVAVEGIVFDGARVPAEEACVRAESGSLAMTDVVIEGAGGTALHATRGATLGLERVSLTNPVGDGMVLDGGASARVLATAVTGAGGAGVTVTRGADLVAGDLDISGAGGAGLAAGGGARVTIEGGGIDGAGGSGVSATDGAVVTLQDVEVGAAEGAGIALYDGARLSFTNGAVSRNALSGIFAEGAGALSLDTVGILGNGEHGVLLLSLREGRLSDVDIQRNKGAGLAIFPAAALELEGTTVRENDGGDILDGREPAPEAPATEASE